MHRALELDEIILTIVITLAYDSWGYCNTAALVRFARVSRAFSDVALKELWGGNANLKALFTCFPNEIWEEREDRLVSEAGKLS